MFTRTRILRFLSFVVVLISIVTISRHVETSHEAIAAIAPADCKIDKQFLLQAGCNLPFKGRDGLDVDKHCPIEGCNKGAANQEQNRHKNDLCATGKTTDVSFLSFDKLQQAVDAQKKFGYSGNKKPLSEDRSVLTALPTVNAKGKPTTLGEGDLVTLTAVVQEAKHDDVSLLNPIYGGEGVNCNVDDVEWNDIHVVLGQTAGSKECSSVTAEIIPHFRSEVRDRFDSNPKTSPAVHGLPVQGLKVKITGTLLFDGSHAPCGNPNKSKSDPARRSLWEIHPVYDIQVLDKSKFISLESWASKH